MRPRLSFLRTFLAALVVATWLGPVTTARAPVPPSDSGGTSPEVRCWNIKTAICTDCPEYLSKFCDARAADGPYSSCIQDQIDACEGFTCADVIAEVGPPCK